MTLFFFPYKEAQQLPGSQKPYALRQHRGVGVANGELFRQQESGKMVPGPKN